MRCSKTLACLALVLAAVAAGAHAEDLRQKVDPWVTETASRGRTEFLVMLREQGIIGGPTENLWRKAHLV